MAHPLAPGATFRSLAEPNYRAYFAGALVSNAGTWMGRVAQDWLVLVELTDHSANALGITTALQFLPMLLLAPWAGVVADRFPKRRVLAVTQSLMLATSLVQGLLIILGVVQLWHVLVLAFVLGVGAAVDGPARQAFASELVGRDLLSNAIGLNAASFNGARLVGPAVAGLVIAAAGTGWVFMINAASFLAFLVALARLDARRLHTPPVARGAGAMREGIAYVRARPDLMLVIAIAFMLGTFGMNFQMTTALMATTVFHKGPQEYGVLGSVMAVGALVAALAVARRPAPRLRFILGGLAVFSVSSAAAALAPTYGWFAVALVPVGLSSMTVLPSCNALVQLSTGPQMRGRVMSLYMAIFLGGTPVGAPVIGWIGDAWGARWTILVGSIATAITAAAASAYVVRANDLTVRVGVRNPWLTVKHPPPPMPDVTR